MKKILYLIVLSILIFSCGSDEDIMSGNGSENESIDFENISGFSVSISSPEKERDYTKKSV